MRGLPGLGFSMDIKQKPISFTGADFGRSLQLYYNVSNGVRWASPHDINRS